MSSAYLFQRNIYDKAQFMNYEATYTGMLLALETNDDCIGRADGGSNSPNKLPEVACNIATSYRTPDTKIYKPTRSVSSKKCIK